MSQHESTKDAFVAGYQEAVARTIANPSCQVEDIYPHYSAGYGSKEVVAYIDGVDDAMSASLSRLRLCYCTHPDQEWCDCDWCRFSRALHVRAAISRAERDAT